ncbi:MAG: glycosyltransferase family 2 protein [Bacteroidaceae bacterium]
MSNQLSVVIPFLNEGEELATTLSQIRDTAKDNVDIIIVNDASTDGNNYKHIAKLFRATYIEHKKRLGSGASKQEGILKSKTPYFIVFDAHMRFYDKQWWSSLCHCLETNPNAIYCLKCKPWSAETKKELDIPAHGGASVEMFSDNILSFFNLHWLKVKDTCQEVSKIPCILGACYASSLKYWKKIKGFEGLEGYGCEEIFVSLKAWMEGSGCYLTNKITVGHLFRKEFPYIVGKNESILNKLYIADTLLPEDHKIRVFNNVKQLLYMTHLQYQKKDMHAIAEAKAYYASIFKENGYQEFLKLNENLKD